MKYRYRAQRDCHSPLQLNAAVAQSATITPPLPLGGRGYGVRVFPACGRGQGVRGTEAGTTT